MKHDILADMFSTIKNAEAIGKKKCMAPASKLLRDTLKVMQKNKYIGDFEFVDNGRGGFFKIKLLGKINDCNVIKPRYSVRKREIINFEKRFLPASNVGILIMTTSKGIIDQKTAAKENSGGKLLGYVY
jgi:small subunit ribosomal protein S8